MKLAVSIIIFLVTMEVARSTPCGLFQRLREARNGRFGGNGLFGGNRLFGRNRFQGLTNISQEEAQSLRQVLSNYDHGQTLNPQPNQTNPQRNSQTPQLNPPPNTQLPDQNRQTNPNP